MTTYFVPYAGRKPASVLVNGHRLIILSQDKGALQSELRLIGADRVRRIQSGDSPQSERIVLDQLADSVKGGVVIAPSDVGVSEVIKNLELELPWLQ